MTRSGKPFDSALTVFMLVRTTTEWLGFPVEKRFELFRETFTPILKAHAADVTLRFFDIEFYSARVTDLWMWDARDHQSYQLLVEAIRETPFWDRYFEIVDILPGIENAYATHYGREPITA
ncbi:darcynin family protein [Methylobacterium sp. WL6]|uniref:darcynin family protein n=1 Tax=Methylobacterium sp. WL6 TaxID=2603901 RepID=UPI0011CC84E7|nr:darcynin family protein [Methylobacterium sp. WL6]TXN58851.1 darcynin [Methylobacterium sp. WL6]